jgi:hypothetical protein
MRKLIFILISIVISFGCFSNIDERLLLGKYQFNNNKADVIDLYKDHTYDHRYINSRGKVFENRGKWRYNGKEILFHNFNFFNDLGPAGGSGVWISRIIEDDRKIHLVYSSDDDTYYVKEESTHTIR